MEERCNEEGEKGVRRKGREERDAPVLVNDCLCCLLLEVCCDRSFSALYSLLSYIIKER